MKKVKSSEVSVGLKAFYTTDFDGHWPVGTAAVVVAETEKGAERMLQAELKRVGLTSKIKGKLIELDEPGAIILCDGGY